jgi:hypothetical protein
LPGGAERPPKEGRTVIFLADDRLTLVAVNFGYRAAKKGLPKGGIRVAQDIGSWITRPQSFFTAPEAGLLIPDQFGHSSIP